MQRRSHLIPVIAGSVGLLLAARASADYCRPLSADSVHAVERALDSLTQEPVEARPGIDRLRWMQNELVLIRDACSRGRVVEAVWRLEQLQLRLAQAAGASAAAAPSPAPASPRAICPAPMKTREIKSKTVVAAASIRTLEGAP